MCALHKRGTEIVGAAFTRRSPCLRLKRNRVRNKLRMRRWRGLGRGFGADSPKAKQEQMRLSLAAGLSLSLFFAIAVPAIVVPAIAASASAQQVPQLNVDPVCRGIAKNASGPGEVGDPNLSVRSCIASEMRVRRQLLRVWTKYSAAQRAQCVGADTAGGLPSYTGLLTCLQLSRQSRPFRQ
jgi:hypothetical protein